MTDDSVLVSIHRVCKTKNKTNKAKIIPLSLVARLGFDANILPCLPSRDRSLHPGYQFSSIYASDQCYCCLMDVLMTINFIIILQCLRIRLGGTFSMLGYNYKNVCVGATPFLAFESPPQSLINPIKRTV